MVENSKEIAEKHKIQGKTEFGVKIKMQRCGFFSQLLRAHPGAMVRARAGLPGPPAQVRSQGLPFRPQPVRYAAPLFPLGSVFPAASASRPCSDRPTLAWMLQPYVSLSFSALGPGNLIPKGGVPHRGSFDHIGASADPATKP